MFTRRLVILGVVSSLLFAALPVLAEDSTATGATAGSTVTDVSTVETCMQTAVDRKNTSVRTGLDAFSATMQTALSTRKDARKAALVLSDKDARRTALKAGNSAWKTSMKSARHTLKDAKQAAWNQFGTDRKACKGTGDFSHRGLDSQL